MSRASWFNGRFSGGHQWPVLGGRRGDFDNANMFKSKFQQARHINDCSVGVRTAFEKLGRKLRLPDDFCQSQTEFDNFRPALTKVVRQFEKLAGISKSRTGMRIFRIFHPGFSQSFVNYFFPAGSSRPIVADQKIYWLKRLRRLLHTTALNC
jgi:hypothetical protein